MTQPLYLGIKSVDWKLLLHLRSIKNHMSFEIGPRKRAMSAKPMSVSQNRPLPGPKASLNHEQRPQGIYFNKGGQQPMRIQSANPQHHQAPNGRLQLNQQQRAHNNHSYYLRAQQTMTEEIVTLKLTIKGLMEQLHHQKMKVEELRKRGRESGKALEWELERQEGKGKGKGGSVHWRSGMRQAYAQLREKYEAKCREMEQLVRLSSSSNLMEQHVFAQIVQQQMQQLRHQHQKLIQARESIGIVTQASQQAVEVTISDLARDKQRLGEKCRMVLAKYDQEVDLREELEYKLETIDKMYKEKDNQVHGLERKIRAHQKQIEALKETLRKGKTQRRNITEQGQVKEDQHRVQIQRIRLQHRQQRVQWQKELQNKLRESSREQAELHDTNRELKQTNQELRKAVAEIREQMTTQKREFLKPQQKMQMAMVADIVEEKQVFDDPKEIIDNGQRVPRRAGKRYSEAAQKKRKVSRGQVANSGQFIRLKCIASHISHQQLKGYFSLREPVEEDQEWCQQYITLKQAKSTLLAHPFSLEEQQAELVGRYLIEDSNQDYVYRDELNQNHREVVKSIMMNLLSAYPVLSPNSKEESECDSLIDRYGYNLSQTLHQVNSTGVISKQKLLETMIGIGIDAPIEVLEVFMGRMALESKNLTSLEYGKVLEQ